MHYLLFLLLSFQLIQLKDIKRINLIQPLLNQINEINAKFEEEKMMLDNHRIETEEEKHQRVSNEYLIEKNHSKQQHQMKVILLRIVLMFQMKKIMMLKMMIRY